MDVNEVRAFLERLNEPEQWQAHDARCGLHPEGECPLLGWVYTNPDFGAGYFARVEKRNQHRHEPVRRPEGYPMVPISPDSRTMLRAPGVQLTGWFEAPCPRGKHVVGAIAEDLKPGPFETIYLWPRY